MGKNSAMKRKGSESLSQPLTSFFPPLGMGLEKATENSHEEKMATPELKEGPNQTDPVTWADLQADLMACFTKIETTMFEKL